jgi:hypothetical protein
MGTLTPPAYATQEDIFFNNNPVDVIEIGAVDTYLPQFPSADYTFYIVWDELNTVDQQRLLNHVDRYGGTVPFGAAVAGFQEVDFFGDIAGGDSTGLDTDPLTAGTLTYFYNPGIAGGDATGLEAFNDDGLPEITRFITRAADSSPVSLDGTHFTISSPTPTDYYVWYDTGASVDPAPGGTGIQVNIRADDTSKAVAQKTKEAILAATSDFHVNVIGNTMTITTVDDGVTTDSTNGDTSFDILKVQDGAAPTARTYTFTHHNGGTVETVSVLGSAATTFTDLINAINPQMTNTTASIDGNGNILFTTSGVGPGEYLWISDDDLFKHTNDNSFLGPIVEGEGQYYVFNVEVDGTVNKYTIAGEDASTFSDLITAMDAAMLGDATTSIVDGNLRITSDTTGNTSSVKIVQPLNDPDYSVPPARSLWAALNGFMEFGIPQHGADDFVDSLFLTERYSGSVMFHELAVRGIGDKPPVGNTNNTSTAVYFDGTNWVRLVDDTAI